MALTAFCEVSRDKARLQNGRVDGRLLGTFRQDLGLATVIQHSVQGCIGSGLAEETFVGRTQRGEVRDLSQADDTTQIGPLGQHNVRAAIIELEKFFNHKTGHQLWLRELLWTLSFCMVWQTVTRCP
jgi:hypothetical protein